MNLNFFHWIMMLGWLSFVVQPKDAKADGIADGEKEAASADPAIA
jgi:hypothetical protein